MVILPGWLGALDRKLLRDIWRLRSQAFAISLVIAAGIGMVVMSFGMIRSLEATRDAYYDRYRFADIFASARRFPERLIDDVQSLDGVSIAEGRLTSGATLDIPGIAEPITTRIHSLPRAGMPRVNALVLPALWPGRYYRGVALWQKAAFASGRDGAVTGICLCDRTRPDFSRQSTLRGPLDGRRASRCCTGFNQCL